MFDPLKFGEELAICGAVLVLFVFLYKYRGNVLLLLTGDDHLHGGILDCIWYIARCCGTCTGEWTRMFTNLPCCPKSVAGANLVKAFGRFLGMASTNVEIRNLVVGDLPFPTRGDFYLSVRCASNPDQVTSLAEDKDPKVVHFPETLTLRLRHSALEKPVKISVHELNLLGSTMLCEASISAERCVDWHNITDAKDRTKRFEMKVISAELEVETPPWILVEFGQSTELRHIDDLRATADVIRTVNQTGDIENKTIVDFKSDMPLLDPSGNPVQEPFEGNLTTIRNMRRCLIRLIGCWTCTGSLFLIIFLCFRGYLYACYQQYTTITMAVMHNSTFPMSTAHLMELRSTCEREVEGTGLAAGIPCRPSTEEILYTCHNLPPNQPEPGALKAIFKEWFNLDINGIPCDIQQVQSSATEMLNMLPSSNDTSQGSNSTSSLNMTNSSPNVLIPIPTTTTMSPLLTSTEGQGGICEIRDKVAKYDTVTFCLVIAVLCSLCCVKCAGNECIKWKKMQLQKDRAEFNKSIIMGMRTGGGTGH